MAVLMNLIQSAAMFVGFLAIAWAGIAAGKWYRDRKETKETDR